jgi:acetoacetate decarboxylase
MPDSTGFGNCTECGQVIPATFEGRQAVLAGLLAPNYLLKIIPHVVDDRACVCELVRHFLEDVSVKGAWTGPTALEFRSTRSRLSGACRYWAP